jgi:hypothetical protein
MLELSGLRMALAEYRAALGDPGRADEVIVLRGRVINLVTPALLGRLLEALDDPHRDR